MIQEYLAQLELSSSNDPCKEIQEKLSSLRDETVSIKVQTQNTKNCDHRLFILQSANQSKKEEIDDDEEAVTKKLIKKTLAEAMLEAKYEKEELEDVEPMNSEVGVCG